MGVNTDWRDRVDPLLLEVLPDFLENLRMESAKLLHLLEDGNYRDIGRIAHNFKGTATHFGLTEIGDLAVSLETHAKAADKALVAADITSWRLLLDQFGLAAS